MKNLLVFLLIVYINFNVQSQSIVSKFIQKEITIISECEIVAIENNSIELKTVIELSVHPKVGDSALALINNIYINAKGYRALDEHSFLLLFRRSRFSDNALMKHFCVSGDLEYIKSKFKVGESFPLEWKATVEVEHYVEYNENNELKLEGYYTDGLLVGIEKSMNKEMQIIVTNNSLGLNHGMETIFENGKKIKEINWFMGKKSGHMTLWYTNGQINTKKFFIDDSEEGYAESFYENGQHKQVTYFYGGKKHGKDTYYYESGALQDEAQYKNGGFDGVCTKYYENGIIHFQNVRTEGVANGPYLRNYENGNTDVKTNFTKGKLNGKYKSFYENGKKKEKGAYSYGDPVGKWTYWSVEGVKTTNEFKKI